MINTVDSFQGQERDIIVVSTVRSNNKRDIGFMKD
jgi:superfamily I DNA and/or RNA helicase